MKLEVRGISKRYGGKVAVENVSFTAESGEAFALLGGNGAGKTTTLRMILGIVERDTGDIQLDGTDVRGMHFRFGYLPEERGLYPKARVVDQLVYLGKLKGMSKSEAKSAVDYWLERLDMSEYANKRLEALSKGNQQKIQFVAALIHDPPCIILDEPFSGLDPINSELLRSIVQELVNQNKILILSSHRMDYIEDLCGRICILKNGTEVLCGNISEIKKSYPRTTVKIRTEHDIEPELVQIGAQVLESKRNGYLIKIKDATHAREILKRLAHLDISVDHFEIVEPSLHLKFRTPRQRVLP